MRRIKRLGFTMSLLTAWLAGSLAAEAMASGVTFNIAAGSAPTTLKEFAAEAHVQLLFDYRAVQTLKTPAVKGLLEPSEALKVLLRGSGFTFRQINDHTFAVMAAPESSTSSLTTTGQETSAERQTEAEKGSSEGPLVAPASKTPEKPEGRTEQLQEVIVTAQKRKEDIQSVPASITAISGETLQRQGVYDFNQILSQVPNTSFQYGTATGVGGAGQGLSSGRGISIRGITGTNTTSFYINDTPVPISMDPAVLDFDHVEVLKGPQGTLYGEASMGGTVKIVMNQPSTAGVSGSVNLDAHDLDTGGLGTFDSVTVNVPLGEGSAMRISTYYSNEPGFLTRTYDDPSAINGGEVTGPAQTVSHVGSQTSGGAMATFLLQPPSIPKLTIEPLLMVQRTSSDGLLLTDYSTSNLVQRRALDNPEAWTDTFYLASLTARYDTPFGKLVSVSSYFYRDSYDQEDGSDVTKLLFALPYLVPTTSYSDLYAKQFTQELRLDSDIGAKLQTTVGVYFNYNLAVYDQLIYSPGANRASVGALGTDIGYLANWPWPTYETAVFMSGTYALTDKLKVSAGVRESFLELRQAFTATGFYNGGPSSSSLGSRFNATTPRFSLQYQPTDSNMIYASAAEGFRPGGAQNVPDICAGDLAAIGVSDTTGKYNSDSLWNYELGSKNRWFDGRLVANFAVYDMEWKDIQETVHLPVCGFTWFVNGAAARSQGTEIELTAAPVGGLTLGASGGYEDARITAVASDSGSLYVGQPLNGVPKWTGSANINYEYPTLEFGQLFFRTNVAYVGQSLSLNNSPTIGRTRPSYTLWDARVGTKVQEWECSLYVKNILNKLPNLGDEVSELPELSGRPRWVVGPPRSVGVAFLRRF